MGLNSISNLLYSFFLQNRDFVPVAFDVSFVVRRPKSHIGKLGRLLAKGLEHVFPKKVGDVDNLAKAVTDELNKVAYHDDAAIVDLRTRKRWAEQGEPAGAYIEVRETDLAAEPPEWVSAYKSKAWAVKGA